MGVLFGMLPSTKTNTGVFFVVLVVFVCNIPGMKSITLFYWFWCVGVNRFSGLSVKVLSCLIISRYQAEWIGYLCWLIDPVDAPAD